MKKTNEDPGPKPGTPPPPPPKPNEATQPNEEG